MARGLDLGKLAAWKQRMATFQSSGLTVVAFCRREGFTPARFYYWARRVRSASTDDRSRQIAKPGQSSENNEADSPASIEVFIGSQVRVRLPASQPELVAAVVSSVVADPVDRSSRGAFQRIDWIDSAVADR